MLKYLHSREASVGQQNWTADIPLKKRTAGGVHPFPSSLLCHVVTLANTYILNTHALRCADE